MTFSQRKRSANYLKKKNIGLGSESEEKKKKTTTFLFLFYHLPQATNFAFEEKKNLVYLLFGNVSRQSHVSFCTQHMPNHQLVIIDHCEHQRCSVLRIKAVDVSLNQQ